MLFVRGVLIILAAVLAAYLVDLWFLKIEMLGWAIPKTDLSNDYVTGFCWFLAIASFLTFLPLQKNERITLIVLWFFRCFTTLFFMLYYENFYYSLDSYGYLRRGTMGNEIFSFSLVRGTVNINALIQVINEWLPLYGSFHALKVIFSFFGFLGVFFLYRAISLATGKRDLRILWFLGLFPSILFWSSIVGKDPLYFLGISLFLYGIARWYKEKSKSAFFYIGLGVFISSFVRIWAAPILLIPLVIVEVYFRWRPTKKSFLLRVLFCIFGVFIIHTFFGQWTSILADYVNQTIQVLNGLSKSWGAAIHAGSGQILPHFESVFDLVEFLPFGIFTALFRPLPGEVNNLFGLLAGLENIFILGFFIYSFSKLNKTKLMDPIVFLCIWTILIWSSVYAFISSQNLGSGFRFRLQIVGFLFLMLFALQKRLKQ